MSAYTLTMVSSTDNKYFLYNKLNQKNVFIKKPIINPLNKIAPVLNKGAFTLFWLWNLRRKTKFTFTKYDFFYKRNYTMKDIYAIKCFVKTNLKKYSNISSFITIKSQNPDKG